MTMQITQMQNRGPVFAVDVIQAEFPCPVAKADTGGLKCIYFGWYFYFTCNLFGKLWSDGKTEIIINSW